MKTIAPVMWVFSLLAMYILASWSTTPGAMAVIDPCVTLTATASLPPTNTLRPTSTTVPIRTTPTRTPTRPLPSNATPVLIPPSQLAPIFLAATEFARYRETPNYNASTAIAATARAYYGQVASPTPDQVEIAPIPNYEVIAVAGMNLRELPNTGSRTVNLLRYGERVFVGEHRRIDPFIWGAVNGGWVAIVYDPDPNRTGGEVVYLRAVRP